MELEIHFGLRLSVFHLLPDIISSGIFWQEDAASEQWEDLWEGEAWGIQQLSRLLSTILPGD